MTILDENIPEDQRQLLRGWRIRVRQIGHEVGRQGMTDEEIVRLLHQLGRATFFTRDPDFYHGHLVHPAYCLVYLAVGPHEVATFVRRVLRHPRLRTQAQRLGRVVRASPVALHVWQPGASREVLLPWLP